MANGSFGLSGVPTAPTTVGSAPNNALTPVSAVVNSTAGFQAGDLVYNFGGDIAPVPGNYVGSATFPVIDTAPVYTQNVSFGQEVAPIVNTGFAHRNSSNIAKLTSGNIVVCYVNINPISSQSDYPAFKIVDENGTVIVAETVIGTSSFVAADAGSISVCALTGGGFAIAWYESGATSTYVSYAIYSNTGSVVKAPATDTGAGATISTTWVQTYARPDGSWILAYTVSTGSALYYKVFSATGVQVYAWTTPGSNQAATNCFSIVVRSDNSFVLFFLTAASAIQYQVRSATNTITTALTTISSSAVGTSVNWGGAALLAGDICVVTWADGGVNVRYATISAAGVASAGANYSSVSGVSGSGVYYAKPFTLANGNYMLVFLNYGSVQNSPYATTLSYAVFNTSHTQVTASSQLLSSVALNTGYLPGFAQTTNYIHMCYSPYPIGVSFTGNSPSNATQINWLKFNPTTYQPFTTYSAPNNVGSSSALPVSGYARAGSTPTKASFFASSTGSATVTVPQTTTTATFILGQTTLDTSTSVNGVDTATLSDGSALVLYNDNGTIKLTRISSVGVVLSTTSLATNAFSGSINPGGVKIAVLSGGNIVCSYFGQPSGVNTLTTIILSSTYSVVTTFIINTNVNWPGTNNAGFDIAALTNNRFVLTYFHTNGPYYRIYSSTGTATVGDTSMNSDAGVFALTCAGTPNGFYVAYYHSSTGGLKYAIYMETSTNSFNTSSFSTVGTSSRTLYDMRAITSPNGNVNLVYANTSASSISCQLAWSTMSSGSVATIIWTGNSPDISTGTGCTQAITPYGDSLVITWATASTISIYYQTASQGISGASYGVSVSGLSLQSSNTNAIFGACGLVGHNVLFLARNSTGQLTYSIINPTAYNYTLAYTSGVTPSNTLSISPSAGFSLVGVSSTAAPANGQGTVVINGPAQLNSNYSASTAGQSFNFQNPVTFGVAGTVSGRNVNLIGNV